jgi:6-phosphofructokinase 1
MGRWAGHIALRTGIASGATIIAIPEIPFDEDAAIAKIIKQKSEGKRSFIVVVSEGLVGYAEKLAKTIQEKTGVETKFARLAHIQRGGKPTLQDRLLASEMGDTAVHYLLEGMSDIVIRKVDGKIGYINIKKALTVDRMFKGKLKDEERAALSEEDKEWMVARCNAVLEDMKRLYAIANEIS